MIDSWLIHTCTIQRDQSVVDDDYRADVPDYADHKTGVKCRLVVKSKRSLLPELGERPVITTYKLLLPAGTDVEASDQITNVVDEEGDAISGTFSIAAGPHKRRARAVRHISLELEKIG